MQDVGLPRGPIVENAQEFGQDAFQAGHQGGLHGPRDVGQRVRSGQQSGARGVGHGVAVSGGLDDAHRVLGPPFQGPDFFEGAGGAGAALDAPGHAEDGQALQQLRLGQARGRAQVHGDVFGRRAEGEAQSSGGPAQVGVQGHHGHALGDLAQRPAHHDFACDQVGPQIAALAQDGQGGFVELVEAGHRASAHDGQSLGQPCGLDDMGRGHRQVVVAQALSHAGQPADGGAVRGGEQVVVPARGGHPSPVAGRLGQALVGPGHPRQAGLGLGQIGQQGRVGADRGRLAAQRRCVPGPADHRDALVALPHGRSQDAAHVGLAAQGMGVGLRFGFAQ